MLSNPKTLAFFFTLAILCGIAACVNKTEEIILNKGYNYYPLKKGKYIIYDVDSTTYDLINQEQHTVDIDTVHFQAKELVADTLKDAQGRPSFKLEYYTRKNDTMPWVIRKVWYTTRTEQTAERVEDNQRFVKLSFPVEPNSKWNMARFIDPNTPITVRGETITSVYKDWEPGALDHNYSEIDKKYIQGNKTFDSTVTVININQESGADKQLYKEIYGRNVGLIYKRVEILATQCGLGNTCGAGKTWYQKAEKGFILEMRLKEFN